MPALKTPLREIESWRRALRRELEANSELSASQLQQALAYLTEGVVLLRLSEMHSIGLEKSSIALKDDPGLCAALLSVIHSAHCRIGIESPSLPPFQVSNELITHIIGRSARLGSGLTPTIFGQIHELGLNELGSRRASGSYYTPEPVVSYLVRQTLSVALQNRSPRDRHKISILDPACGGGAFLLGALDYLFGWYLDWYLANSPETWANRRRPTLIMVKGEWRLTPEERARIALHHLHGVDLDPEAVAITTKALSLKVFEGAQGEVFPLDWSGNICCGNALIESDITDTNPEIAMVHLEAIQPFDWQQAFPAIMAKGGFDVVLGNPPFSNYSSRDSLRAKYERDGHTTALECLDLSLDYCAHKYAHCSSGTFDLYKWFTARSLELTRRGGQFGFIIPNTWLTHSKYGDLKKHVAERAGDLEIVDLGGGIFPVTVPTCMVIARKGKGKIRRYVDLKHERDKWSALAECQYEPLGRDGSRSRHALVQKYIARWPVKYKLGHWLRLREGVHIQREQLVRGHEESQLPVIDSKNMGRYRFGWEPAYSFTPSTETKRFRSTQGHRIVIRKTGDSLVSTLTPETPAFVLQSLYQGTGLKNGVAPEFLLGLINSKFLTYLYQCSEFGQKGRVLAQFRKGHLDQLPVPRISLRSEREKHDHLVKLVLARLGGDANVESQIDALVFELYGLTEEEIRLVCGN